MFYLSFYLTLPHLTLPSSLFYGEPDQGQSRLRVALLGKDGAAFSTTSRGRSLIITSQSTIFPFRKLSFHFGVLLYFHLCVQS